MVMAFENATAENYTKVYMPDVNSKYKHRTFFPLQCGDWKSSETRSFLKELSLGPDNEEVRAGKLDRFYQRKLIINGLTTRRRPLINFMTSCETDRHPEFQNWQILDYWEYLGGPVDSCSRIKDEIQDMGELEAHLWFCNGYGNRFAWGDWFSRNLCGKFDYFGGEPELYGAPHSTYYHELADDYKEQFYAFLNETARNENITIPERWPTNFSIPKFNWQPKDTSAWHLTNTSYKWPPKLASLVRNPEESNSTATSNMSWDVRELRNSENWQGKGYKAKK